MKQFRKLLAVLLSVLMLCSVLPLSAIISAADVSYDGYFYNGDFEAGTNNWTMHNDADTVTEVVDDPTASGQGKVMHTNSTYTSSSLGCDLMFNQVVALEANTDVILKFKVYCYSTASNAAFWVTIGDSTATYSTSAVTGLAAQTVSSSSSTRVRLNVTTNTNKWVEVAIPYNTGNNTSVEFRFDNYRAGAGQYYFDDITIEGPNNDSVGGEEPNEPTTSNGLLVNGDFENGDANWTKLVSTIGVVADPTGAGQGNVMQTNENGGSVHMFQQGVQLSANTDYILTYKVYTYAASGTNPGWWVTLGDTSITYSTSAVTSNGIEVKMVDSSSSTRVRFTITNSSLYNKWVEVKIPFNSGNNTAPNIIFSNYRANAGQYYFDDIVLVRADGGEEPEPDEPDTPDTPSNPDAPVISGNLVKNGTFESGDANGWSKQLSTAINAEAAYTGNYGAHLKGNGGWGSMLSQSVDVVIGKSYTLKLWLKVVAVGVNVQIKDGGDSGTLLGSKWASAAEFGEWTELSWVVSPTTNSLFINLCGAGNGNAEIAYLDDVSVVEAPLMENGDFENGDLSGWEKGQSTAISANAAYEGNYGANIKGNGSWNGMLNRNLPVKDGYSYEISFWYKINSNGFNFQFKGVQSGYMYASGWYSNVGTWTRVTKTITVDGDGQIMLNFCGAGNGIAEDAYIDSITFVELKQASNDGFILNGDFEIGGETPWTVYSGTAVSTDAAHSGEYGLSLTGNGSWDGMAYQDFDTEVGKIYSVTMWLKTVANGTNAKIVDVATNTALAHTWFTDTAWTQKTFEFTATGTKTRINFSGGGNGLATTVYVDDIVVIRVQDPSFDGYLYNGDFEAGTLTKWEAYQQTTVSANAAHSGSYGAILKGSGNWNSTMKQTFDLDAGKTYKVSFWYKPVSNGVNFQLKNNAGTSIATLYLDSRKVAIWTYYEVTFESAYETSLYISFGGSGNGSTDEVWVDDIKIENLSGEEMDRIENLENGGTSIRDVSDDQRGLAFRFFVNADDIAYHNDNEYTANTGSMKLFKYADTIGKLVKFGAVVTNQEAIGTDKNAFTLENVNGSNTLDIAAKYLIGVNDTSACYAVRIINIPDAYVTREIYARPYYIYEVDGEQFTIYGNIEHDSYEHVSSIRRSLKVLAIGNSFSIDAMNNHLYDVLKSADYDQIILGNLYIGGCSLDTHWRNMSGNLSAYDYYKNDNNGQWVKTPGYTALTALQEENWDVITIQQASPNSGQANTYGNLENIVNWIEDNKTNHDAEIYWHMTWAYQQNSTHEAFPNYGSDQMTMYNAILDTVQNTVLNVEGIDGVIPAGTAIQNLRTSGLGDTLTADGYHLSDTYGDYTASLTWYRAITGESMELVDYIPSSVSTYSYDIFRAAAHAVATPYAITDLSEIVLVSGSDFQPNTWEAGIQTLRGLTGSLKNNGHNLFDGMLFVGDYTQTLGSDFDSSNEGLHVLDDEMSNNVIFNKVYSQGNHDAAGIDLLNPYGNNDPANAPYGVFVINEDDYSAYGTGGQQVAADLTAYFNEKLANGWGNKPIFVMSHLPLHYNYRTIKDKGAQTAIYIVDALNSASDAGLNIIFLIAHNHSGGYDDYLGGAAIYIPKGDSILVPNATNVSNAPVETELRFTYMNAGYVSYYNDMGTGADTALTMTTFRIQKNGDVIITRYDKNGVHNLKSAGKVSPYDPEYTQYTADDARVYESSRIVGAYKDEEYTGE